MRSKGPVKSKVNSAQQIKKLKARVQELEETYLAIKRGRVDALVISGPHGDQVFTLQGAEHPYRVLVETMNEGAATISSDGTILYANTSLANILDRPLEDVIGTSLSTHFATEEKDKLTGLIEAALRGEAINDLNLVRSEVRRRLVRLSMSPVHDHGHPTVCVVATDLTELSGTNDALKASEDILRNLSGRLLRLQDEERRRISRDLHDVTGQKLALLSMDLSRIFKNQNIVKDAECHRLLSESISLSNEMNEEIRTLSYVLHPPLLDELGLAVAVQWFTQGFESRTGIHVTVDFPSEFVRLAPDAEVALFRIVQESLTNVHRYSGSSSAFVRARSDAEEVRLEIGDSGKGFSEGVRTRTNTPAATLGVGIQGMKERLRQLSGMLEITSQPGRGTLVTAVLPISAQRTITPDTFELVAEVEAEETVVATAEAAPPKSDRKRILIADDHDVLRRGVRTLLEKEPGLEICGEAVDGKDALEQTLAQAPDLVILDINMPILNGLDVVRQIVRLKPQTKILAFSFHASKQIVEEIIAAGAHSYVSKAAAGQNLIQEVNLLLNKCAQTQDA